LQPHISLLDHMFRWSALVYGATYILLDPWKYTIANCQDTAVLFYSGMRVAMAELYPCVIWPWLCLQVLLRRWSRKWPTTTTV
jgi:hypothetical protein